MDYTCLCNCQECSLTGNKVLPYIPLDPVARVLLVGQAPGKTEIVTGAPFTGPAGKMLYACLKGAGLDKRRLFITNLVLCKPPEDKKGNDLAPTPREIMNCNKRLQQEILDVKPTLIVALGGPALYELTGQEGIQSARGGLYELREKYQHKCPVLAVLHPSYVMRQRQWVETTIKDLSEINRILINGAPPKETEYEFLVDPSYHELAEYLSRPGMLAFDTETTGLNTRLDKVIGMSFSNSYTSAAAILLQENDPRLALVKEVLENADIKKATQNGSYDCAILHSSLSIDVAGMQYDTRLAEQLMNSDMPTSLDHLRAVYTKIKPYKPTKSEMKTIAHWGKERMLQYANWDAVCTYQVMIEQKKVMTPGQLHLLETLLIPLVPALNSMSLKGVLIDINQLAGMYANNIPKLKALEEDIQTRIGINPHSPKQVKDHFQLDSSDRRTLEYYIERGDSRAPDMQLVLDCRDLKKESGTYLKGLYDRLEDNYIHTSYLPDGTGTGRLSSRNPNLQNIPKHLRRLYVAEDGCYLVSGDYKQLELWVGSVLAPCSALHAALQDGVDVHSLIANEMKAFVPERLHHKIRIIAKTVVFGTFYGRGARSIAIEHGCTVQQAEEWQRICFSNYPGLVKYVKDRYNDYETTKVVTTPWGRHRVVSSPTQAFNTPVQSSASDITMSTLVEMYQQGFDLRLTVHDEIVFQCAKEKLDIYTVQAKGIFERPIPQLGNNSFPAEFKYGENWFEMTKWEAPATRCVPRYD
jgi:DNA polymerase I